MNCIVRIIGHEFNEFLKLSLLLDQRKLIPANFNIITVFQIIFSVTILVIQVLSRVYGIQPGVNPRIPLIGPG